MNHGELNAGKMSFVNQLQTAADCVKLVEITTSANWEQLNQWKKCCCSLLESPHYCWFARYGFVFKIGDLASSSWPFQWAEVKFELLRYPRIQSSLKAQWGAVHLIRNIGTCCPGNCAASWWFDYVCVLSVLAKMIKKIDHVLGGALRAWYRWFPSVCTCVTAL